MNFTLNRFRFKKRYVAYVLFLSYVVMSQSCMRMRYSAKETKQFFTESGTQFQDKYLTIDGHQIHYIQTGDGAKPTLFFIHGSPGSWNAYKDYLKDTLLLKKYRMIAIDRPGFGYSDFGMAENLAVQSKYIAQFIAKMSNQKEVVLIGHSMGGPVVAQLAADYPNRYQHLVILAGSLDPAAEKPEKWRTVILSPPLRYLIPGALRPSNDELWWLKEDLIALKPKLPKITSGVTIIHGTKDDLVPFSNVAFMKENFSNAASLNAIVIENANHFIPWSHYDIVRDAVLKL